MFNIVSKLFSIILMPAGILLILLIWAFFTKNTAKARQIILSALFFFYIFSNPYLTNELFLCWEIAPTPISKVKKHTIAIVLTGGATNDDKLPKENIFLSKSGDRIGQTLQLFKKGKINRILISGGSNAIFGKTPKSEAYEIAQFLEIGGVPKDSILLEVRSINTRQNAVNSLAVLKKQYGNNFQTSNEILLISSAFHLRRANACFEKLGIKTTLYGADYLSHERQFLISNLLPREECLAYNKLLFREIIGYLTYKIMGWI